MTFENDLTYKILEKFVRENLKEKILYMGFRPVDFFDMKLELDHQYQNHYAFQPEKQNFYFEMKNFFLQQENFKNKYIWNKLRGIFEEIIIQNPFK